MTARPLIMAPLTGEARTRARDRIVADLVGVVERIPMSLVADENHEVLHLVAELAIRRVEEAAA